MSVAHWIRRGGAFALDTAYQMGLYRCAGAFYRGVGVIFTLHRVVDDAYPLLYPGHMVSITSLDRLMGGVRALGWEFVGIDEVHRTLVAGRARGARPFACFTSDDGYADNLANALPIFRKHRVPLCVYVTTSFVDRSLFYWWGGLEHLVLCNDEIRLPAFADRVACRVPARSFDEKVRAFQILNAMGHREGARFRSVLKQVLPEHSIDAAALLDRHALSLPQLRQLASDPLVTIGAHCITHERLSSMTDAHALNEMEGSRTTLERWLNCEVHHLAYPFGRQDSCGAREFALAQEAGFLTAVTTRQGNIFPAHRDHLYKLPRRSVPLHDRKMRSVLFGVETLIQRERRFRTF